MKIIISEGFREHLLRFSEQMAADFTFRKSRLSGDVSENGGLEVAIEMVLVLPVCGGETAK